MLYEKSKGGLGCSKCGMVVRWIRMLNGMWIAVEPEPVLYIPGEGKRWLVEFTNYDAELMKNCLIYEPFKGMDISKVEKGYMPHVFICPGG